MIAAFCEKHPHTMLHHPTRGGVSACSQCKRAHVESLDAMLAALRSRQRYKRLSDMPTLRVIEYFRRGRLVRQHRYQRGGKYA